MEGEFMGILLGLGMGIMLIFGAIALVAYILVALALMTMADKQGIENAWLAFLPIANMNIIGKLLGKLNLFGTIIDQPEMILPLVSVASIALANFGAIGSLVSLISFVISIIAYYQLVEKYKQGSGILYVLLLVVVAPVGAYLLYSIRENTPMTIE